jgi:type I restriction enzyme S subunit
MNEIREIPKGWTKAIFEDLLDYIQPTKFIVESTEYDDKYKTPVLTAGKSFIIGHTNETNGIFNEIPVIIFDDFTTATKFVNFPFKVKSSAMKILSPVGKLVNIKYVFGYMQTLRINADTHKRYWISHYSQLPIPVPPLPEQHRIVAKIEELFSSLDKGIESLKTAQQQLQVYRQAVLKWAFEGKLTNRNVVEGELPDGWKWVKLGEVCTNVEYGSAAKSKEIGKVPVLRMGNIQGGKIDWDDLVYTDDEIEINKYLLRKNDVLFNRTNSPEWVGKTAMYKGERPAIFAGYLIRINRIEALIDASYLTYYLNSHIAKKYGNSVKSFGVNQANINGTKLKTYPLPLPLLSEQHEIVAEIESRLSVCDKIEESIEHSLKQSEALRQSILKKAFEGKLVSQDPNGEPASVLLDRIKAEREKSKLETPPRRQAGQIKAKKAKS